MLASRSRILDTRAVNAEHLTSSERVREALALLWTPPGEGKSRDNQLLLEQALKVQNYFTQPFFCAEPYTAVQARLSMRQTRYALATKFSTANMMTCRFRRSISVAALRK